MEQKRKHAFNHIIQDIKTGSIARVCLLCGTEQFLVGWARDQLIKRYVNQATKAMDLVVFEAGTFDIGQFKESCDTLPMFSERKVVVLEGFDAVWGKADKDTAPQIDELIEYLPNIPDETLVIIAAGDKEEILRGKKNSGKNVTPLFATIQEEGTVYDFRPLGETDLQKFILKRVRGAGKTISKRAIDVLISASGYFNKDIHYALYNLESDLSKIIALTDGDEITERAVSDGLSDNLENNVFKMLDSISKNNKETAFKLLDDILKSGAKPMQLLATIAGHLELMLQVKELQETGAKPAEIASQLKVHPYRVEKASGFVRSFSVQELRRVLKTAFETDNRIKSGLFDERLALQMLIAEI